MLTWVDDVTHGRVSCSIDGIDDTTVAYHEGGREAEPQVGGFTWSGHFTWESLPEQVIDLPHQLRVRIMLKD